MTEQWTVVIFLLKMTVKMTLRVYGNFFSGPLPKCADSYWISGLQAQFREP